MNRTVSLPPNQKTMEPRIQFEFKPNHSHWPMGICEGEGLCHVRAGNKGYRKHEHIICNEGCVLSECKCGTKTPEWELKRIGSCYNCYLKRLGIDYYKLLRGLECTGDHECLIWNLRCRFNCKDRPILRVCPSCGERRLGWLGSTLYCAVCIYAVIDGWTGPPKCRYCFWPLPRKSNGMYHKRCRPFALKRARNPYNR